MKGSPSSAWRRYWKGTEALQCPETVACLGSGDGNRGKQKSSADVRVKSTCWGVGLTRAARTGRGGGVLGMILGFLACVAGVGGRDLCCWRKGALAGWSMA